MNVARNALILLLVSLAAVASAQSSSKSGAQQQFFNLEDAVPHPEALSDAELAVLAKDNLMRKELGSTASGAALTQDGLEATAVQLCNSGERDVLVIGDGPPFKAAYVGPFWIIRDLPSGPVVVLAEPSLSLTIETKRSNKCLNVTAFAVTATEGITTQYKFNGTAYAVAKQSSAKLPQ